MKPIKCPSAFWYHHGPAMLSHVPPSRREQPRSFYLGVPLFLPSHLSILHSSYTPVSWSFFCSSEKSDVFFHRDFLIVVIYQLEYSSFVSPNYWCVLIFQIVVEIHFLQCNLSELHSNRAPPNTPVIIFTSPHSISPLWYCLKLFCFILYCLPHHLSYPSFMLEYKFSESTDDRNLVFLNIHWLIPSD